MEHSLELWASFQHPWLEFKSTVYLGSGCLPNCPCVNCFLALWPWSPSLQSSLSLLLTNGFHAPRTIHALDLQAQFNTSSGACMPGFVPTASLNHIP